MATNPPESELRADEALTARITAALAARGPGYRPRTRHLTADGAPKYTNRLILESSPYLLQHAHNPVNWFPWGDEAFALAKKLGRPVFLSVGYSTCHWCHVMEEESFEDEEIADYLNANYVPIKVDREERPDVDAIYMRSVQILTGRGGWPMSVWLTADRRPFYAGTYFPPRDGVRGARKGLLTILAEQRASHAADPSAIADDAKHLAERIAADMAPPPSAGLPGVSAVLTAVRQAQLRYDPVHGGARGAPKFPSSFPVRLLLRHARRSGEERSRDMALTTLRSMAAGGMYDQLGGGFHRYSTDDRWLVPHFEKMLYDNAQLALAYLEGWQLSGDAQLQRVAREVLDYLDREMTSTSGGYLSASDADSLAPSGKREEGYYFTWTPAELEAALGRRSAEIVARRYGVTPRGNLDGRNVLYLPQTREAVAADLKITPAELDAEMAAARPQLLRARAERPAPLVDDKILVSWNGLAISAMARGAFVLGEARYLASAERAASALLSQATQGGRLRHSFRGTDVGALAFAEDYAMLAAGLLDLFEAGQQARWLAQAVELMDELERHHGDGERGGYYRGAGDAEELLAREKDSQDGPAPCADSVAAAVQLRLATMTGDDRWRQRAEATLRAHGAVLERAPAALTDMLLAVDYRTDEAKQIVLITPKEASSSSDEELAAMKKVLAERFLPSHVLVIAAEGTAGELARLAPWTEGKPAKDGRVTAYLCEQGACELPTSDPATLTKQLSEAKPYMTTSPP